MSAAGRLKEVLEKPEDQISETDLIFLEKVIAHYPYFQAARLKFVQCLFATDDLRFDKELANLAIQTFNRDILFQTFYQRKTKTSSPITTLENKFFRAELNHFTLSGKIEPAIDSDSALVEPSDLTWEVAPKPFDLEKEYKSITNIGGSPKRSTELIEDFLKSQKNTVRKLRSFESTELDPQEDPLEIPEDLVSETLAKIYIKQNKIEDAIRIYEKLCLLEPEKKQKFARLIDEQKKKLE